MIQTGGAHDAARIGQLPMSRNKRITAAETARSSLERCRAFSCKARNIWSTFLQAPKCLECFPAPPGPPGYAHRGVRQCALRSEEPPAMHSGSR
eukprot:5973536-Alexandrium_andersonii.AAC.1